MRSAKALLVAAVSVAAAAAAAGGAAAQRNVQRCSALSLLLQM